MESELPPAWEDHNAPPDANQVVNEHGVSEYQAIGKVIGQTRSNEPLTSPERERGAIGAALATHTLLRVIDRAGVILDSGDIVLGMTTAINSASSMGIASWAISNGVMLALAAYLLYPAAKRIFTAIHNRLRARYTSLKRGM